MCVSPSILRIIDLKYRIGPFSAVIQSVIPSALSAVDKAKGDAEDENYLSTTISSYIMMRFLLLVAIPKSFLFVLPVRVMEFGNTPTGCGFFVSQETKMDDARFEMRTKIGYSACGKD